MNPLKSLNRDIVKILVRKRAWRKLLNYAAAEFSQGLGLPLNLAYPYWLTIDPTNFCQLRCPFCPTGAEREVRKKAMMRLEDFKKVLDALGPYLLHIDFMNWGEPLLNRQVYDMIAYAKKFDIDTKLDTNFNAFDEEAAGKMVRSGLDAVSLSIDGASPETYAKYRVRGDFERVIGHLKLLVRKRAELKSRTPHIIWQFLVFKHNEHEVELAKKMGEELGVDTVGITPANMPFNEDTKLNWIPANPQFSLYNPDTLVDQNQVDAEIREGKRDPQDYPDLRKAYAQLPPKETCNWPWGGITVNPNGSVSSCCSIEEEEYDFGNVFTQPFWKLWNGSFYRRARNHVRRYTRNQAGVDKSSKHSCERCHFIGRANFRFQRWWAEPWSDHWKPSGGGTDSPPEPRPKPQEHYERAASDLLKQTSA